MTSTSDRPLALVTGASSGIGLELALQLVDKGFDLVIAAEDDAVLQAGAGLRKGGADVQAVQVDLGTPEGVEELFAAVAASGRPLAAAAINAGVGVGGPFTETDLQAELELISLNVSSTVHVAKRVTQQMVRQGSGRILFSSSIAARMPGPFQAVYAASKAFVQSFAQALRDELKDTGVSVTALMPGPTDTEFFERADMMDTPVGQGPKDDASLVARQGIEAMMAGRDHVVAGSASTKLQGAVAGVLPDPLARKAHRSMSEPTQGD